MNRFSVVMAGGGGTRFWPLSRQKTPKQLLNLTGKDVMAREAVKRLLFISESDSVYVVTNAEQKAEMDRVLSDLVMADNILSEPCGRNTTACIGYAAEKIVRTYGDGVMIITPSDHYIRDEKTFVRTLIRACEACENTGKLVTIGIKPSFPATGYGYIQFEEKSSEVCQVKEFREKPDYNTASEYIKTGHYLWNSGMFIWKASVVLDKIKTYVPDIYNELKKIGDAVAQSNEREVVKNVYPSIRSISIDYSVMEPSSKNGDVLVVPGEFGWYDVGSWDMLDALSLPDENDNISKGDTILIDTHHSIIHSSSRLVSVLGADNLVVVETPDAIMVCPRDRAQEVGKIVGVLKDRGRSELL